MGIYFDTNIEFRAAYIAAGIQIEMQRHKDIAVAAISSIAHFEKEAIVRVLAYAYLEENIDAVKLAYKLDLRKEHFLACIDDYDSFKEIYLKNQEYEYEREQIYRVI